VIAVAAGPGSWVAVICGPTAFHFCKYGKRPWLTSAPDFNIVRNFWTRKREPAVVSYALGVMGLLDDPKSEECSSEHITRVPRRLSVQALNLTDLYPPP